MKYQDLNQTEKKFFRSEAQSLLQGDSKIIDMYIDKKINPLIEAKAEKLYNFEDLYFTPRATNPCAIEILNRYFDYEVTKDGVKILTSSLEESILVRKAMTAMLESQDDFHFKMRQAYDSNDGSGNPFRIEFKRIKERIQDIAKYFRKHEAI